MAPGDSSGIVLRGRTGHPEGHKFTGAFSVLNNLLSQVLTNLCQPLHKQGVSRTGWFDPRAS